MIEDVAGVIDALPVAVSAGNNSWRPAAAAAGRRRSSTVESRDSSSLSVSSSLESWSTPKKKVLLATPTSPPVSRASNVMTPAVPVTTSSSTPRPMLQTRGQVSRPAGPVLPWTSTPQFQQRPFAVPDNRCVSQNAAVSAATPAVDFTARYPGRGGAFRAPVRSPVPGTGMFQAPVAYRGIPRPNFQGPATQRVPGPRHAGRGSSGSTSTPSIVPSFIPASGPRHAGLGSSGSTSTPSIVPSFIPVSGPRHAGRGSSGSTSTPGIVPSLIPASTQLSVSAVVTSAMFTPFQAMLSYPPPTFVPPPTPARSRMPAPGKQF